MLGYDNQSYFIKTFKSIVGVTPMEYRRSGAAAR
jgi:two-component system response regulator YesN